MPSAAAAAGTPQAAPGFGPHADQLTELDRRTSELTRALEQSRERLSATEKCLSDHDQGMRGLDARFTTFSSAAPHAAQTAPQAGVFGSDFGATFLSGGAERPFASQATGAASGPETHDIHSLHGERPRGPWKLYDEKFLLDGKNAYDAKNPATWLEDLRDYLSGRTPELDKLFAWAELALRRSCHGASTTVSSSSRQAPRPSANSCGH